MEVIMLETDAITLTQQLVRIESTDPGSYEGKIGDFIWKTLDHPCIKLTKEEVLPGRFNIMAKIQGETDDPALIYICHMDTVVLGENWTCDPLGGEYKNGRIYGRGACDMKSGLACAMSACLELAAKTAQSGRQPKHSFALIATVDEEDFMRGVEKAIESGWVTKNSWVLDTEPTNGMIQVAHKGRAWFEVDVEGITAHASTPWKGADAIAGMAEIICGIRKRIMDCPKHEELGASTVTFGQITGGYRPYVVPDRCKTWIDMRLAPPVATKDAAVMVEEAIAQASLQVPGIRASYVITGDRPYVERDDSSFLLESLKNACEQVTGEHITVTFFPGYTDSAVIAGTLGNSNCMSYGPGDLELAHKPDESVPCEDILRCQAVLITLAENMIF